MIEEGQTHAMRRDDTTSSKTAMMVTEEGSNPGGPGGPVSE